MAVNPVFDPAGGLDSAVPWHFGDPHREQRLLASSGAVVDQSHRGILQVSGSDRLSWLNDLVSQRVDDLPVGASALALILDPHGHIQFELRMMAASDCVWITTEPGAAEGLSQYLSSMKFLRDVTVTNVSDEFAAVWVSGDFDLNPVAQWLPPGEFRGGPVTESGVDAGGQAGKYVPDRPGVLPGRELIITRAQLAGGLGEVPRAGTWALEALRVGAGVPRIGLDTDHRTLPHEIGLIGPAVHLAKGCYRGQETVARVHNLGRPPRRLVILHFDGSAGELPEHGTDLSVGGKRVGFVGSVARHYELGPIGLALLKSNTPSDVSLECEVAGGTVGVSIQDVVVAGGRAGAN